MGLWTFMAKYAFLAVLIACGFDYSVTLRNMFHALLKGRLYFTVQKKQTANNFHLGLAGRLHYLHLDYGGSSLVIKKRLKEYYKREKLGNEVEDGESYTGKRKDQRRRGLSRSLHYDYFVVIDFEATCDVACSHAYR